jgi:hypothetical protein
MTVVAPERATTSPSPCLTAAPWAGPVITLLFVVSIAFFAFAILGLGPLASL